MTEKERMLNALFPAEGGEELTNLKFFVIDSTITEEELCREVSDTLEAHRKGELRASETFDGHLRKKWTNTED